MDQTTGLRDMNDGGKLQSPDDYFQALGGVWELQHKKIHY